MKNCIKSLLSVLLLCLCFGQLCKFVGWPKGKKKNCTISERNIFSIVLITGFQCCLRGRAYQMSTSAVMKGAQAKSVFKSLDSM